VGADLILGWAPWPTNPDTNEPAEPITVRKRLVEAADRIDTTDPSLDDTLALILEDRTGEYPEDRGDNWRQEVKDLVRNAVDDLLPEVEIRGSAEVFLARDATILPLEGKWWLFAGGTSWGDSPEGLDALSTLSTMGFFGEIDA
jgi:hypothetical protein